MESENSNECVLFIRLCWICCSSASIRFHLYFSSEGDAVTSDQRVKGGTRRCGSKGAKGKAGVEGSRRKCGRGSVRLEMSDNVALVRHKHFVSSTKSSFSNALLPFESIGFSFLVDAVSVFDNVGIRQAHATERGFPQFGIPWVSNDRPRVR